MSQLSRIAVRNVSRNKRRSLITLLAIFIGVTLVVALKGFANGFIEMSIRSVVQSKTGALQIHRTGYLDDLEGAPLKLSMPYSPELIAKIRSVPGITGVTGRIQFNGLINNGLSQTMFVGRALDVTSEYATLPRSGTDIVEGGRRLEPTDRDAALLGLELAQSFNAMTPADLAKNPPTKNNAPPTSSVTLNSSSPEGRANSMAVNIVGLTNSGFAFENKRVVTVPLAFAQDLLNMHGRVTEYAISIDAMEHLPRIMEDLRRTLGADYEVTPWSELQPFLRDIISRQQFMLNAISIVLFVIIITGIINTMLMSVFERVREIGTMLALGVKQGQIRQLFLFEAATIGGAGGFAGAAAGRGLVGWMHHKGIPLPVAGSQIAEMVRPAVSVQFIAASIVIAIVASLLAAAYPSFKASKMNPVDALRSV